MWKAAANTMKRVKITVLKEGVNPHDAHQGEEGRMHRSNLGRLVADAKMLLDLFDDTDDLPEWLETKITKAADYIQSAKTYLSAEMARDQGVLEEQVEGLKVIEGKPFCMGAQCRADVRAVHPETGEVVAAAGSMGETEEQALKAAHEKLKVKLQKIKGG